MDNIYDENIFDLTKREEKILKMVVEGYENSEIAEKLFVSIHTIKFYVSSIIKKLNAKNRTHAAYIATKNNLIK